VSLELLHNDRNHLMLRRESILSVITQNRYRFDYLFPDATFPCYVVPNFPIYRARAQLKEHRQGLVLAGTAIPGFGLCAVLDFLASRRDAVLTVVGTLWKSSEKLIGEQYGDLVRSGRVRLPTERLSDDAFIDEVARHRIGFAFYDLRRAKDFFAPGAGILPASYVNYWTGFPGKAGMYASAGVPVVGSDLPGLEFVRQEAIGTLIPEATPEGIDAALKVIDEDYSRLSANCVRLAQKYCFRRNVLPFIDHLATEKAGLASGGA
jgi:hypothetical protein